MLKRLFHSVGPIGIGLGGDAARLLQLEHESGGMRVLASARVEYEALGISFDPDDPAPDKLVNAITRRIHAGGFRDKKCAIAVPNLSLEIRSARLPDMPEGDLLQAVYLDAPGHLGFEEGEASQVGWLKTGEVYQGDDQRVELLYFGAPEERMLRIASSFEAAGFELLTIEPRFVSITRALTRKLRRSYDQEIVQLVLDVCESHTCVLITRGCEIVFCKILPIGGKAMDKAAERKLGLDPEIVRELRRQRAEHRDDGDQRIERAMFDAVRPIMAQIGREASLCLRHYSVTFRGARPERCLLSGTEVLEPAFVSVLSDALGTECEVVEPLEGIKTDRTIGSSQYGPSWAAAAGIAMRDLLVRGTARKRTQRRNAEDALTNEKVRAA